MKPVLIALLFATLSVACSDGKSIVVVSVLTDAQPIANVAQLRVRATTGQMGEYSQEVLYPEKPRAENELLEINSTKPVTFSMTFRSMFKGTVTFQVEALDVTQTVLASGESSSEPLSEGQITYATVTVRAPCDPLSPAIVCGNGRNCALICDSQDRAKLVCVAPGLKNPGDLCNDLSDCVPGAECFQFACAGTSVKTCRQFCNTDADCGAGSVCNLDISCPASATRARVCTRACNPTGEATQGCVPGLRCFVYAGEITDCACSPASRISGVGQPCTEEDDCLPGLTCVDQAGQKTCRALCMLVSPLCPSGTTCTPLSSPVYRVYGACL